MRLISSPAKAESNMVASLRSTPMKQRRRASVMASRGVREGERECRGGHFGLVVQAVVGRMLFW